MKVENILLIEVEKPFYKNSITYESSLQSILKSEDPYSSLIYNEVDYA